MKASIQTIRKVILTAVFIVMSSQSVYAHPSDSDSVTHLPNNFRIIFNKDVNIKPNTTSYKLSSSNYCSFLFSPSVDDRVIYAGTTVVFQVLRAEEVIASSDHGLKLSCYSRWNATIGNLREVLRENFGAELVFPAPVPFSQSQISQPKERYSF
jgi:hypothetical protein